jgi:hypothetical protein
MMFCVISLSAESRQLVLTTSSYVDAEVRPINNWLDLSNQQFEPDKRLNVLKIKGKGSQ